MSWSSAFAPAPYRREEAQPPSRVEDERAGGMIDGVDPPGCGCFWKNTLNSFAVRAMASGLP